MYNLRTLARMTKHIPLFIAKGQFFALDLLCLQIGLNVRIFTL